MGSLEDFRKVSEEQVRKEFLQELVFEEIIKLEGIEATEEEIAAKYLEIAGGDQAKVKQVKKQYQEVARQAQQLEEERTQLAEVVSRASMLEISHFQMIPLNKRDRKTTMYNQIQKLQFDYTIGRNITNKPGMKMLYMRITRPDGEIMQKSINDVFKFENSEIAYSISKEFEYAGEEISSSLYWQVEEILQIGWYNADFFVDGELIGSFPFEIRQ